MHIYHLVQLVPNAKSMQRKSCCDVELKFELDVKHQ